MVTNRVPDECSMFLNQLVNVAVKELGGSLESIYLYGSVADGGFDPARSDLDLIIFLNKDLSAETLSNWVQPLLQTEWGKKVDGMFLQVGDAGKDNNEIKPYPYLIDGSLHTGHWNINAITWWSLEHQGILLYGKPVETGVTWSQVERTLTYNIEVYWPGRAGRIHTFLKDAEVADAVATLCRIAFTWEERKIISKPEAVRWAGSRKNVKDVRQLREAERLLNGKGSTYFSRLYRAIACRKFVLEMVEQMQGKLAKARPYYLTK
ncbi:nucleotidyltransferase domain-containing protein [Jeotgalibacillus terrae]|uniref:Nucleotidyltransferase domain-containing protein n=1 Tax=Jeotgalibacillus terrae TaxID=587735 RepID=A0ABW5ZFP7_9BACL|nr:nucleotidyltransferase domain-containing protein [Jeotgalibacillus terrae]MBM7579343.1 hypothetical protein [Jeotgalibacillus terrae]